MTPEQRDEKIHHTLSAVLGLSVDQINDDTSPDNVTAWDSVMHLNLVLALEEAFGALFTPEDILLMNSCRAIRQVLSDRAL